MNPSADATEQTTTLLGAAREFILKGRGWSGAREWRCRRDGGGIAAAGGGWSWRAGAGGWERGERRAGDLSGEAPRPAVGCVCSWRRRRPARLAGAAGGSSGPNTPLGPKPVTGPPATIAVVTSAGSKSNSLIFKVCFFLSTQKPNKPPISIFKPCILPL